MEQWTIAMIITSILGSIVVVIFLRQECMMSRQHEAEVAAEEAAAAAAAAAAENGEDGDNNTVPLMEEEEETQEESPAVVVRATTPAVNPNLINRWAEERKPGEPVFDKLIVGGTLSLGLLLFIGGITILIISLVDRQNFNDTAKDDFQSLGPKACLIESAASYETINQQLNRLQTMCLEEWTYNVQVTPGGEEAEDDTTTNFVSNTFSRSVCRAPCEFCPPQDIRGENSYAGVVINKPGEPITNSTYVECWASRKDELSDFYNCNGDSPSSNDDTEFWCYQLQDPNIPIKAAKSSNQLGLIAAWVGLVGGAFFVVLGSWFICKNRAAQKLDEALEEASSCCPADDLSGADEEEEKPTKDDDETKQNEEVMSGDAEEDVVATTDDKPKEEGDVTSVEEQA